jgi:cathepsin X
MFRYICVLILATSALVTSKEYKSELINQDTDKDEHIVSRRPHEYLKSEDLPKELDYRSQGLLTTDLNQHIPVYCGSCWAHAAMSSIADRIKIATKGKQRDVIPSIQALINCGDAGTCNGGNSNAANRWVYSNGGIPDLTCQQYQAKNMDCTDENTCMNCDYGTGLCYPIEKYPKIEITEYGHAKGDEAIMSEIYARGPVSAYINANCIEEYTGGINMYDTCNPRQTNHAIQLNGWGTENGTDYWIGRNSWGTYWGEHGFFKIVRGGNYQPGEGYYAVPVIPKFE